MTPYRRNYKQMETGKLRRSILEMQQQQGDAYDKIVDNDADLSTELFRARAALQERSGGEAVQGSRH